jgi:hypothetical protein
MVGVAAGIAVADDVNRLQARDRAAAVTARKEIPRRCS